MPAFILAIFLSAFLLFQVQPIVARYILPWYGGSPAVWTTCMLFFQVGLLAGYTWAHLLVTFFRSRPKLQVAIHLGALVLSLLLLPITPSDALKPTGTENPTLGIVTLLLQTVGIPYLLISASGPLLQSWFGNVLPGRSPYRLYAVSNFGSLLGLLSYPFVFEPWLRVSEQTGWWSVGYGVYAAVAGICGWFVFRKIGATPIEEKSTNQEVPRPAWVDRILWVTLAACGSIMMIATTSQMCQDVAVVPFLWVLPLSLYLLTFIIAFDAERWYWRPLWVPLMVVAVGLMVHLLNQDMADSEMPLAKQIAIYMAALFTVCMVCHGEMVRLKPHPHFLTGFYLAVSLGGAIGGMAVGLVAPRVFDGYWELHLVLMIVGLLLLWLLFMRRRGVEMSSRLCDTGAVVWALLVCGLGYGLKAHIDELHEDSLVTTRGFYGALRVYDGGWGEDRYRALYHGRINHGIQYLNEYYSTLPATYYTETSGVGTLFEVHPARKDGEERPLKYGCVGLGVGTLAAFAQPGDTVRFYEINDQIETLARDQFTYLEDCKGDVDVVIGDARISLEQELAAGDRQNFDILVVDAFSGDSIPIHLLTREAFELYFEHLKPGGTLVVHITNLHLDLSDPVRRLAEEFDRTAVHVEDETEGTYAYYSDWVLITNDEPTLKALKDSNRLTEWWLDIPNDILWTDDYSNLLDVLME